MARGRPNLVGLGVSLGAAGAAGALGAAGLIADRIRRRVKDPVVAEKLIPRDHGFGVQRVPLETVSEVHPPRVLQGAFPAPRLDAPAPSQESFRLPHSQERQGYTRRIPFPPSLSPQGNPWSAPPFQSSLLEDAV